jgi:transposase
MVGSMAGSPQDERQMSSASSCGRLWYAHNSVGTQQRGRVAIVITDNLRTHTSAGSLLVCSLLAEFKEHLYLVYTPAYDPDANRIEWLWLISRRVVTHNHRRCSFELAR